MGKKLPSDLIFPLSHARDAIIALMTRSTVISLVVFQNQHLISSDLCCSNITKLATQIRSYLTTTYLPTQSIKLLRTNIRGQIKDLLSQDNENKDTLSRLFYNHFFLDLG